MPSPADPTIWSSPPTARSGSRAAGRRRSPCWTPPPARIETIDVGRSPHGIFLNPKAPVADGGVQPLMGDPFDLAAGWLQEHLLIPVLYQFGLMNWEDVSYGWALFARLRRRAGRGDLRRLPAAGALAPGRALAGPHGAVWVDIALHDAVARRHPAVGDLRAVLPRPGGVQRLDDRPRLGPADAGGPVSRSCWVSRSLPSSSTRSSWTSPTTGGTGCRTGSAGGGRCIRCITRSGR